MRKVELEGEIEEGMIVRIKVNKKLSEVCHATGAIGVVAPVESSLKDKYPHGVHFTRGSGGIPDQDVIAHNVFQEDELTVVGLGR